MNNFTTDQDKQTRFLFLNLAYILRKKRQEIKYGNPQWDDPEKGFSITMFRVGPEAYAFAEQCCKALGKEPLLECGTTMSVNLDTVSEKNDFFDRFKMMMEQAEDELLMIGGLTPHEYYFLNCNPVIAGTEDGQNNHYVFLQAEIRDDLDREVCRVILGDCEIEGDGRVDIKVSCYRKKWRDRLVRYLEGLG